MMNIYTVSFFGHRILENPIIIEQKLEDMIRRLISEHTYVEFLVGRNGDFDQLVSSTVRRIKRTVRSDNSALVLVLPYSTAEYRNNQDSFHEYYDSVEICEADPGTHFKALIQHRNRHMVDRSDEIIFCVEHNSGGAAKTMHYAISVHAQIRNLCCFP